MNLKLKNIVGANGYEIVYSSNKKFAPKSTKKALVSGTEKTLTKLRKKTGYYVKVRAYKKDSLGRRVYGSYSKVGKVKIIT